MYRTVRSDKSEYFTYERKGKEVRLIKQAYKKIGQDYKYFSSEWARLRKIGQNACRYYPKKDLFWFEFEGAFMFASEMRQHCLITDPHGEKWHTNNDRLGLTLDATLLYNLMWDIDWRVNYYKNYKLSFSVFSAFQASLPADNKKMSGYAIADIHLKLADRLISLYGFLLETFCKLCPKDDLFAKKLKELNTKGGLNG